MISKLWLQLAWNKKKKKFEEGNTYKVFSEWMALSET